MKAACNTLRGLLIHYLLYLVKGKREAISLARRKVEAIPIQSIPPDKFPWVPLQVLEHQFDVHEKLIIHQQAPRSATS